MKHFRCSVWGEIKVSNLALSIIDTFELQRLHHIKTTGFAYKVFPCATSSRFEHSIGVYHVTKSIIDHVELELSCDDKMSSRQKELMVRVWSAFLSLPALRPTKIPSLETLRL